MTSKYIPISPEYAQDYFPFDDGRYTLTYVSTEMLLMAIEEKERQKRAYEKEANETIRRILSELKRRERLKSRKDNNL